MKFRTKMILAYTTVALLISLALGLVIYRISVRYEENSQKINLTITAKSFVTQIDDRLGRMDAILNYILSDPSMLESMTILGRGHDRQLPSTFEIDAKNKLQSGISTEYIIRNSYRTVYFNDDGYLASSAVKQSGSHALNQRLVETFDIDDLTYLDPVREADGRTALVGPHDDFWAVYGQTPVYSLMKAPRGYWLGYLEVENRVDTLSALASSDPDIRYVILINGDELLFDSETGSRPPATGGGDTFGDGTEAATEGAAIEEKAGRYTMIARDILGTRQTNEGSENGNSADGPEKASSMLSGKIVKENGNVYAAAGSDQFDVTVLVYKTTDAMTSGRNRIFLTSFLAAAVMFGLCLVSIILWSNHLTKPVRQLQEIVEDTNIENLPNWSKSRRVRQMEQGKRNLDEFAALAHSYRTMTGRLNTALENEKRASLLQLQAQFDTLQTQVNPHFIYNVLNVISSRAVMADDEVICEMCGCLGNMLRYSTNNKARYAKVEEELTYLDSYFYLLKSRYEDKLHVTVDMQPAVLDRVIPKMTLQQVVENSIKHGFHDKDKDMEITLTGRETECGWYILIRDNGVGATQDKLAEIHGRLEEVRENFRDLSVPTQAEIGGIGLTNTFARCLLLFQERLVFELGNVSEGSGFEVRIGEKA